jgi:hypothetical protein
MFVGSCGARHVGGPVTALRPVAREPAHGILKSPGRQISAARGDGLEFLAFVEDERGHASQGEPPSLAIRPSDGQQLVCENHPQNMRLNNRTSQTGRGYLSATALDKNAGILPHMTKATTGKSILRRIDKRLAALAANGEKLTDRSLSLAATGSPDTLRSIRRNMVIGSQRGISTETIIKLAPKLKTTVEWLINESGQESLDQGHIDSGSILSDAPSGGKRVPIVGYVGAGSEAHFYALADSDDFTEVEAPADASDDTVAVEIRGKSWGPLMDSWLVFYDDIRSPVTDDLFNETCVVGLADDRILLKKIRRERDGSFTLLSNSNEPPITDAVIEWAAKVTGMRPR